MYDAKDRTNPKTVDAVTSDEGLYATHYKPLQRKMDVGEWVALEIVTQKGGESHYYLNRNFNNRLSSEEVADLVKQGYIKLKPPVEIKPRERLWQAPDGHLYLWQGLANDIERRLVQ